MTIYKIKIKERLSRIISVKADSLEEAFKLVEEAYDNDEIILDGSEDNLEGSDFTFNGTMTEEQSEKDYSSWRLNY